MKKVNINLSSSQPNFSVVIPVIHPCIVSQSSNKPIELTNIDWGHTCPELPTPEPPQYPVIEPFEDDTPKPNEPKLSITKEELLDKCQEEMKNCAKTIKRIRESGTTDEEIDFKYKLLTVIHEQIEVINMVL